MAKRSKRRRTVGFLKGGKFIPAKQVKLAVKSKCGRIIMGKLVFPDEDVPRAPKSFDRLDDRS